MENSKPADPNNTDEILTSFINGHDLNIILDSNDYDSGTLYFVDQNGINAFECE